MTIVIACLAAAGRASAQYCEVETLNTHSEGKGLSADFSSVDTSTCALGIETIVHVDANQGVVDVSQQCGTGADQTDTETTTRTDVVNVIVSVYDRCLGTQVRYVTGTGQADDIHLSQNFKTANLRAAFQGLDASNQLVSIAIDLVWDGFGRKEQTGRHQNSNQKLLRYRYASSGTIREAIAAGSVLVDDTDETPAPSTGGTIERDAVRELVEYR
jgi:hypothetical protein